MQAASLDTVQLLGAGKRSSRRATGLITMLFGCWHRNLSRPITSGYETYGVLIVERTGTWTYLAGA